VQLLSAEPRLTGGGPELVFNGERRGFQQRHNDDDDDDDESMYRRRCRGTPARRSATRSHSQPPRSGRLPTWPSTFCPPMPLILNCNSVFIFSSAMVAQINHSEDKEVRADRQHGVREPDLRGPVCNCYSSHTILGLFCFCETGPGHANNRAERDAQ
jgi:hypothetical protein